MSTRLAGIALLSLAPAFAPAFAFAGPPAPGSASANATPAQTDAAPSGPADAVPSAQPPPPQPAPPQPASPASAQPAPAPPMPMPMANAPTDPSLSVAQVRLTSGQRVSRLIGATVTDDKNQKLGTVDDLILGQGDRPTLIVLQVGGLLGVGGKLIALPFSGVQVQGNQVVLPGEDPKALAASPAFSYGN